MAAAASEVSAVLEADEGSENAEKRDAEVRGGHAEVPRGFTLRDIMNTAAMWCSRAPASGGLPDAAQSATLLATSPGWRYEPRTVPGRASSRNTWLTLAAIALATTLVYAGSFAGDWISDDVEAIAHNPILRSLALNDPPGYLKQSNEDLGGKKSLHAVRALRTLAASDPAAAAETWLGWHGKTSGNVELLFTIVSSWAQRDANAARAWIDSLDSASGKVFARHAWLSALARRDVTAAQRELAGIDLGDGVS